MTSLISIVTIKKKKKIIIIYEIKTFLKRGKKKKNCWKLMGAGRNRQKVVIQLLGTDDWLTAGNSCRYSTYKKYHLASFHGDCKCVVTTEDIKCRMSEFTENCTDTAYVI